MPNLFLGFPVSRAKFAEFAETVVTSLYTANEIYFYTRFESLDGWAVYTTGGGTCLNDVNKISMKCGGAAGGMAVAIEQMAYPIGVTTWAKKRKFKTKPRVDVGNDANSQIYICTGDEADNWRGFGFRYMNTKLIGYAQNGGAKATVDLITGLSAPYVRTDLLEAIFEPGVKVDFYVNGSLLGTVATNLPTGTTDAEKLLKYMIYATVAVNHQLASSEAKFTQAL